MVDLSRILTRRERFPSRAWIAEAPSSCYAQKLRDLDSAHRNAFAGRARAPRFKSRRGAQRARVAFDQRHAGKARAWLAGSVVLPGLGAVTLRGRRLPRAMPKLVPVARDARVQCWVSFAVEEPVEAMASARRPSVGVGLGVARLATLSTGETSEYPRTLGTHLVRLRRLQQRLARQCKGSTRRVCTRARIAECRREPLHRLSHRLVCESQVVALEGLNADGMGGSAEAAGTNVRAKRGLNRSLKDAAFGAFGRQLAYMATWYGRTQGAVDWCFASSKRCSACGACTTVHDRDANAAKIIEDERLRFVQHPQDTGGVRASSGEGNESVGLGTVAVSARIGWAA